MRRREFIAGLSGAALTKPVTRTDRRHKLDSASLLY
jgi:hypothetical protein